MSENDGSGWNLHVERFRDTVILSDAESDAHFELSPDQARRIVVALGEAAEDAKEYRDRETDD